MNVRQLLFFSLITLNITNYISAQSTEDTTSLLEPVPDSEKPIDYTTASFKTDRIINLHSLESTAPGVLDFKISHRFGSVKDGLYDMFGLDEAQMRLGFDLGLTDRLAIGVGRSNYLKVYDGYVKYKVLRQRDDGKMPITASIVAAMGISTVKLVDPKLDFNSRLYYCYQLLLGRKFSEGFTFELAPTLLHRNYVTTADQTNDVIAIGAGIRQKISRRVSLNLEYIYVLPNQLGDGFKNAASIGFDIETGGHVFQLHFSNSQGMNEKGFITETTDDWKNFEVHFGFNISRVFTLWGKQW